MKTKEEKLNEELDKIPFKKGVDDGQYNDGLLGGFESGFNAGIEFAENWISVDDELPESDDILFTCIVKIEGKRLISSLGYEIANFDKRCKKFNYRGQSIRIEKVTHWRPINRK